MHLLFSKCLSLYCSCTVITCMNVQHHVKTHLQDFCINVFDIMCIRASSFVTSPKPLFRPTFIRSNLPSIRFRSLSCAVYRRRYTYVGYISCNPPVLAPYHPHRLPTETVPAWQTYGVLTIFRLWIVARIHFLHQPKHHKPFGDFLPQVKQQIHVSSVG